MTGPFNCFTVSSNRFAETVTPFTSTTQLASEQRATPPVPKPSMPPPKVPKRTEWLVFTVLVLTLVWVYLHSKLEPTYRHIDQSNVFNTLWFGIETFSNVAVHNYRLKIKYIFSQ